MTTPSTACAVCATLIAGTCLGAYIPITYFEVQPAQPASSESVTLIAMGEAGYNVNSVTSFPELIFVSPGVLEWNLYLELGHLTVITPWAESVELGPLPADDYVLTVRTWAVERLSPPVTEFGDELEIAFTVTPEPAMGILAMLVVCAAVLHRRR